MATILEGVVVGGAGGAVAGFVIWLFQWSREKITERGYKKRVYEWLYKTTENHKRLTVGARKDPRWKSTIEIASYTNLTPDRARYICSVHDKIRCKTEKDRWSHREPLEDKWAIREFVD